MEIDGALALDRYELWEEPQARSRVRLSQAPALKPEPASGTVAEMSAPAVPRQPPYQRRREARATRRAQRFALLAVVALVLVVTLILTAFGSANPPRIVAGPRAADSGLLPPGPPKPQVVALQGPLRIQLPIAQSRVTAIAYHAVGSGALALEPLGKRANESLLTRFFHQLFGGGGGGLRYYQLGGGDGPSTGALNVGAPPGTDVYAPVDGTVVGITDYVLSGRVYGARIDVQPAGAPSLVVSLTHLRPDPALTVGSVVVSATSKIGSVIDFSSIERQALAQHTQDSGNHVALEVHPAATLALR